MTEKTGIEAFKDPLERAVDITSLSIVLEALEDIARGKAEHLRSNWQDENSARAWDAAANILETAAFRTSVRHVSGI